MTTAAMRNVPSDQCNRPGAPFSLTRERMYLMEEKGDWSSAISVMDMRDQRSAS